MTQLMRRCPKCSNWFSYPSYSQDIVHECRNSDGTRKQKREEEWHQGTRVTLKFDKDWWFNMGINPKMPFGRISESKWKKIKKELIDVDTYIEL